MTTLTRVLVLVVALVLAPWPPARSQSTAQVSSELQVLERLAEERYAEGDLQKAAELYQELGRRHPDQGTSARSLFTAAWLLELSGDQAQALATLERSLTLDPQQPFDPTLYNRPFELLYRQALDSALRARRRSSAESTRAATEAMRQGDLDEARALLTAALELSPDNPSALYNLALLDLDQGATPKALGDFERVVSLTYQQSGSQMTQLRAKALTSIGLIYRQQGRNDDAEQSFLEATRADAQEASAWTNLGLLYRDEQRYEAANTALERAHELRPDDRDIALALASSLEVSGRPEQAASLLSMHLQRHPNDAATWIQLARIEVERGATEEAIRALERGIAADSQNRAGYAGQAASQLANLQLQLGDTEAATTAANQAIGWDRSDPDAWGVLGQSQLAAGQTAQAIASLNRAAELEPESIERLLAVGEVLMDQRQWAQAEAIYLRALTLDPTSAEAAARLETVRSQLTRERAIVAGKARPRKPIPPKKIGLDFAGIDYKDLQLRGALVKNVNKKSPAARAGLRKGDLILWIGDYSVLSDKDFYQFLKRNPPTDSISIEYLRDGRIFAADIVLR